MLDRIRSILAEMGGESDVKLPFVLKRKRKRIIKKKGVVSSPNSKKKYNLSKPALINKSTFVKKYTKNMFPFIKKNYDGKTKYILKKMLDAKLKYIHESLLNNMKINTWEDFSNGLNIFDNIFYKHLDVNDTVNNYYLIFIVFSYIFLNEVKIFDNAFKKTFFYSRNKFMKFLNIENNLYHFNDKDLISNKSEFNLLHIDQIVKSRFDNQKKEDNESFLEGLIVNHSV